MKKCIDNIIFDLGGVLFDIEYNKTFEQLGVLLGMDLNTHNWPPYFKKIIHSYETGSINTETFLWNLQRMSVKQVPNPHKIIAAWNAMLKDWHPGVIDMLNQLNKKYNLFLLSNINDLHYQYFLNSFENADKVAEFNQMFIGTCYSNVTGYKKPDFQAYDYLFSEYSLEPSKTLFIDDVESNVQAAREMGIHSVHHDIGRAITKKIFFYLEVVC